MERALEGLKELALFMLAAQMIVHFLPGKQYEKYGKLIAGIVVLAKAGAFFLHMPELSLPEAAAGWESFSRAAGIETADPAGQTDPEDPGGQADQSGQFRARTEELEREQERMTEQGMLRSVEQMLSRPAAEAGVAVLDVRLSDGTLVIGVGKEAFPSEGGAGAGIGPKSGDGVGIGRIDSLRVEVGENAEKAPDPAAAAAQADAESASGTAAVQIGTEKTSGPAAAQAGAEKASGSAAAAQTGTEKTPGPAAAQAGAAGRRGVLRDDLARAFAAALGMREEDLEVVEVEQTAGLVQAEDDEG